MKVREIKSIVEGLPLRYQTSNIVALNIKIDKQGYCKWQKVH